MSRVVVVRCRVMSCVSRVVMERRALSSGAHSVFVVCAECALALCSAHVCVCVCVCVRVRDVRVGMRALAT